MATSGRRKAPLLALPSTLPEPTNLSFFIRMRIEPLEQPTAEDAEDAEVQS